MMNRPSTMVRANENVIGVEVKNARDENLGKIEEIMLEKLTGKTCYVVLSFGGVLGMGEKYFAMPWNAIHYNKEKECFILDKNKEELKNAPGFDPNNWPDMADSTWGQNIHDYYKIKPYWEE